MAANNQYDAIIIGCGIAGGALATVLARAGKRVLALERAPSYRDRVRGEWLAPWGVAELQRLGLYDDFIAAGAHHLTRHINYSDEHAPAEAEAATLPLGGFLPGVPGPMTFGHPAACELLAGLAAAAGATVVRGADDLRFEAGAHPSASWTAAGRPAAAIAPLLVGADGRTSRVRRALGITLHEDPQHHLMGGMLVEHASGFPDDLQAIGSEGDVHYLVFPQGGGRARLYLGYGSAQRDRFAGDDGPRAFLEAFRVDALPYANAIADATPAGPCASYPNQSTWTDIPYATGGVLIGDAAGYNDPIIGQGLSISYRDVRIVSEILLAATDWSDSALFAPYAEERRERMRRLRFTARVQSIYHNEFGADARRRRGIAAKRRAEDPLLNLTPLATMIGPDRAPAAAFEESALDRLFAEDPA